MKNLFFLTMILLGPFQLNAQSKSNLFRLNGKIDAKTGIVLLMPTGGDEYNPDTKINYEAKIKNGTFTIEGKLSYPSSFIIAFFPKYISSPFILKPGNQTIICKTDSLRETPNIDNGTLVEELKVFNKTKPFLLAYTIQHPNSYVALWELIRRMDNGYEPIFDSIYTALSPSLKNTYSGKVLNQRLKSSKVTAIGHVFPTLNLLDTKYKPVSIPNRQQSKYTLVDFWFSRCSPCLAQFPKFKALFTSYKNKGFDIIAISIDKKEDLENWKKTIKEKDLFWNQYVDLSGKLTIRELSIGLFPTNFLLDEKGTIIKKNVSTIELSKFLSENLEAN